MARPPGFTINRPAFDYALRVSGLSLTEVSRRADVPHSTLSRLTRGLITASGETARKVAAVFDVEPVALFPTFGTGDVLTIDEVADRLRVSREHARRLIATNRLQRVPDVGRRVLVTRTELQRFLRQGAMVR